MNKGEAVPLGGTIATVPIMGRYVACASDDEAGPELLRATEAIGAQVATLEDTCLHAAIDRAT